VQLYIERGTETEESEAEGFGLAEAVRALGGVKPVKPDAAGTAKQLDATRVASKLELPELTPVQRRRRAAFKVAAVLSVALHAGSLYAFLAWHGSTDSGALDTPSEAISVEIVASRTLEARQPQQASEPAPSPDATAPVEGKAEASEARPAEPPNKEMQETKVVVPPPPFAVPDAQEEVMRAMKRETPIKSEAPPVPEQGPAAAVAPPPKAGDSADDAPAKRKPQKQEERKRVDPVQKGGQISKSNAGKGRGGERVSASRGAILNYASQVRARVAGNKPSGGGSRGTSLVTFGVTPSGGLAFASLARSSGDAGLDRLAVGAVRSAAPFPPPPPGATSAQLRFTIPFYFE
jgi:TonB family protein